MVHKEGEMGVEAITSVSFSPVCLCVSCSDIIGQEIWAATGLQWHRLTKDIKHKIQIQSRGYVQALLKLHPTLER